MNEVELVRATHDEAAQALKGAGRQVRLRVQYRPEEYNRYEARLHEIQQVRGERGLYLGRRRLIPHL